MSPNFGAKLESNSNSSMGQCPQEGGVGIGGGMIWVGLVLGQGYTPRPMIKNLHHIGIAVSDLDEGVRRYRDGLGLCFEGIEEVPTERVRVAILLAGETRIELLQGVGDDSPISKFVAKKGPGIHHLAFEVADGQVEIDRLRALGMQVLDESPRPGAHGCKVVFVHPRSMEGVLTELVEVPR